VNEKKHAYSENKHKWADEEPEIKVKIPYDSVKTPPHVRQPLTGFKTSARLRANVLE
jgi:hypothetical protein